MQEYNMSDYGGGRSPAGKCVGWHYLTEEQYQKKKSVYEAKQAAKSSSAQDNLESRSWPLTYIQQLQRSFPFLSWYSQVELWSLPLHNH